MANHFVLQYQQTDGFTYWADKVLILECEQPESETSVSLKILEKIENIISNLKEQGLNNKSISQYIEGNEISISGESISLSEFVYFSENENKFIYKCDVISLEEYANMNARKFQI